MYEGAVLYSMGIYIVCTWAALGLGLIAERIARRYNYDGI